MMRRAALFACLTVAAAVDCVTDDGGVVADGTFIMTDDCNTCSCENGTAHCTSLNCSRYSCRPTSTPVDLSPVPDCTICSCEDEQLTCVGLSDCALPCQVIDGSFIANGTGYHPNTCSDCVCVDGELQCVDTGRCSGEFCVMDNNVILYEGIRPDSQLVHTDSCNTCRCTGGNVKCSEVNCSSVCQSSSVQQQQQQQQRHAGVAGIQCLRTDSCACQPVLCWGNNCQCNRPDTGAAVLHGESYQKSACTTCLCNDGDLTCTNTCRCLMDDGSYLPYGSETFVDECNRCLCDNGTLLCSTLQCDDVSPAFQCDGGEAQPAPAAPSGEVCTSTATCQCWGSRAGCDFTDCADSKCVGEDGRFVAEGTVFEWDCNTCRCTRNVAVCTNISCGYDCVDEDTGAVTKEGDLVISDCLECYCIRGSLRWCSTPVPGCNSTGTPDTSSSGGNTAGEDDDDGGDSVAIAIGCTAGCVAVALIVGIAVYYFRFSKPKAPAAPEPAEEMDKKLPSN